MRVKAGLPASTSTGLRALTTATGTVTGKVVGLDTTPPGLATLRVASPAVSRRDSGTNARSCLLPRKVVNRAESFQRTWEPGRKLAPLMTRSKPGTPATALLGVSLVMTGLAGLSVT